MFLLAKPKVLYHRLFEVRQESVVETHVCEENIRKIVQVEEVLAVEGLSVNW